MSHLKMSDPKKKNVFALEPALTKETPLQNSWSTGDILDTVH